MKISVNNKQAITIVIVIIVTVLITLAIVVLVVWGGFYGLVDRTIRNISTLTMNKCRDSTITIRESIIINPTAPHVYDKKLATCLLDAGTAVSSAYCKDDIPIPKPFNRYQVLYGLDNRNRQNLYAYIFWADNSNTAAIIFAGTYNESQWYSNLRLKLVNSQYLTGSPAACLIHRGFSEIYSAVRPQLWQWWRDFGVGKINYLAISGQSLGGALSTICAYDFFNAGPTIVHYSFASPRLGNREFAAEFNSRLPKSIRVYNTEDVVPTVPGPVGKNAIYEHVGLTINNKPFTKNLGTIWDNHVTAYHDLPN